MSETLTLRLEPSTGPTTESWPKAGSAPAPANYGRTRGPARVSPLVYVGFGVGAAGLAVGSVTGILSLSKASRAKDHCEDNACREAARDDIDGSKTLANVSNVAFAVGVVGIGVGVYGLLSSGKERKTAVEPGPESSRSWEAAFSACAALSEPCASSAGTALVLGAMPCQAAHGRGMSFSEIPPPPEEEPGQDAPFIRTRPPGPQSRSWLTRAARTSVPMGPKRAPAKLHGIRTEVPRGTIVYASAKGSNVLDVDGNRYVDLAGGFGAMLLGHSHPNLLENPRVSIAAPAPGARRRFSLGSQDRALGSAGRAPPARPTRR